MLSPKTLQAMQMNSCWAVSFYSQACLVSTMDNTKHWFNLLSELLVIIVSTANINLLFWNTLQKSPADEAIENIAKQKFKETKFQTL